MSSPAPAPPAVQSGKPIQVKLVLLGEAAVGKSSLVLRFVSNDFTENKEPTIGAAFLTQKCRLEDKVIKFEIWDTAGQERFHSLAPMYYRNASAAVVVYDITKAASLDKAKAWVKELQRQANPNIVIALAGNKLDLADSDPSTSSDSSDPVPSSSSSSTTSPDPSSTTEADDSSTTITPPPKPTAVAKSLRQVSFEEASAYAAEAGLLFFETSAKSGVNVGEVFTEIAKKIPLDSLAAASASSGPKAPTSSSSAASANTPASGPGSRINLNAGGGRGGGGADGKAGACAC